MHTVLVVEDEKDILELVTLNLQRQGYKTLSAANGIEGVTQAKAHTPDLIILDIMMPGKDGYAVFKDLKEDARTRSIPVLMLTANGDVAAARERFAPRIVSRALNWEWKSTWGNPSVPRN